jgi:translation initiation factor 5B
VDEREVAEMAEPEEPNIVEANDSTVTKSEAVAKTSRRRRRRVEGLLRKRMINLDKILVEL